MGIKSRRLALNMTQEDLAEALGVERSTVSMWEIGQSLPRVSMLPTLAKLLSCTIEELLVTDEAERSTP